MRRLLLSLVAVIMLIAASASSVAAKGPQPGNLGEHGWSCFFVEGLGVHCAPPGSGWPPPIERATPLLYWFDSTEDDVTSTDLEFSGTELIVPHSQWDHGTPPCPQENLEGWTDIGIARACHHN